MGGVLRERKYVCLLCGERWGDCLCECVRLFAHIKHIDTHICYTSHRRRERHTKMREREREREREKERERIVCDNGEQMQEPAQERAHDR